MGLTSVVVNVNKLSSDSAELSHSSSERGERTKKSETRRDLAIICRTVLEPVFFAVGLLVMNLHSASWTYTSQMQISKSVSTSDIFIKPWCAFGQVSMTTVTTMLFCKSGCSLSARIPNSAPCKPDFYQNHPQTVFPCGFTTLAQTVRLSTKTSVLGAWSEYWTSHSSLSHWYLRTCGWKAKGHQDILYTHMQYCRTYIPLTGGNVYADLTNGWT